jgi:hypothetical protein
MSYGRCSHCNNPAGEGYRYFGQRTERSERGDPRGKLLQPGQGWAPVGPRVCSEASGGTGMVQTVDEPRPMSASLNDNG